MTSSPAGGMVPHHIQGTEFYSHAEAKILAETYYNIGNDLYQALLPNFQANTPSQEDVWRLYPVFVNLSFSCEIVLSFFMKMIIMEKSPEVTNYIKNSLINYLMIQKNLYQI